MQDTAVKLLLIDDDNIVRQSIVDYLEDSGYLVHDEAQGSSGIAWFEENRPDLVVTDLRMPDIDGLAILKKIREIDSEAPVIVISGMGVVKDVVQALRLGADDFLVKPLVDMEVLTHSIGNALERRSLRRENNRYRTQLEEANKELKEYVTVLERDQLAGRRVQKNLLPESEAHFGSIRLNYKIIPSLYLSGDFIDYGFLSGKYLAFYLTDVSGHGAASAFVTVWLKQIVRRFVKENAFLAEGTLNENKLSELLYLVNNEVVRSKIGCHMTCFVGVINVEDRTMHYIVSGHLPLPVLLDEKKAQFLSGKGKPIGLFSDATWDVNVVTLPQEFSLIVFSDGVLEVLPKVELIEKEAYLKDKLGSRSTDLGEVCKKLDLNNLATAPDDIAILKIDSVVE